MVAAAGRRDTPRSTSLVQWLRARTDAQLTQLLRERPDLALPAPHDAAALAARLAVRTSVQGVVDRLDAHALGALETLALAADDDAAVPDALELPGVATALDTLFGLALVWGEPDLVHLAPSVRESLGPYPAGLGRPAALLFRYVPDGALVPVLERLGIAPAAQPRSGAAIAAVLADPDRLAGLLDGLDPDALDVLHRLAAGPPVGAVRTTRPDPGTVAGRLLLTGLLAPLDGTRVELPREVGLAVRAGTQTPDPAPPTVDVVERGPRALDELGTSAVRETLRLVETLATVWTAQPPALLRAGGVGVRELRRTARELDVEETTAAVLLEVAFAAGLVNSTTAPEPAYLPTAEYDSWLERDTAARWVTLGTAWLSMSRQPSLIGQRDDRERVINALGPDAERGTIPTLRRHVLDTLAALPPGAAPGTREQVLARLAWQAPRRASGQRPVAEAVLREADLLGVTAAGGITGWMRTLLAGSPLTGVTGAPPGPESVAAAERALEHALPPAVDHFLVQPDLTVVVPGPPDRAVGTELGLVADVESTGGASVYRITERTVRRALDAGRTAEQLLGFLRQRSTTPVPQALDYLIDDVARRHGVLRAGVASAYLRCEDEALLARVAADRATGPLGLRLLAPTVAISDAPIGRVLDVLRDAGYAPAAEAPSGAVVTLEVEPARAGPRPAVRSGSRPVDAQAHALAAVRRLRQGDELASRGTSVHPVASTVPGVTSAATMELLRTAVREDRTLLLGYADPDGATSVHVLSPYSLAAGSLRGYEEGRPGLASYLLHRITSVKLLEDTDEAGSSR